MRCVLVFLVLVFAALWGPPRVVAAEAAGLFASFDAQAFDTRERRLLQTALAASGDYRGSLDGIWTEASRAAMTSYTARLGTDGPRGVHVALLVLALAEKVTRDGWDFVRPEGLGLSFALPLGALAPVEAFDDARRWQSPTGGFAATGFAGDASEADLWHAAVLGDLALGGVHEVLREPELQITAGTSSDGWAVYLHSERLGETWRTLSLEAAPDADAGQAGWLALTAASLRRGAALTWDMPADGQLAALVDAAIVFLAAAPNGPDAAAAEAEPATVAFGPDVGAAQALPPQPEAMQGAGTGFYLGERLIVTAEHVIAGCAAVTLADGRPLELVGSDADLDVAALAAPAPAPAWLSLGGAETPRLGQPVHALGFPYYALAGTSLNLTSGNVSALTGIDDDDRFFSFSAPVQPGNSGGPLLDRTGAVAGLVVARLSESFIADATGTLPQNMNYALGARELSAFLERSGLAAATGGIGGFDMSAGAPSEIGRAIVPILCR